MRPTDRRAGFTLIELLLVIVILGILIALTLTVGSTALSGGKSRQTQDTVRVVDSAVETYYSSVGQAPPAFVVAFTPKHQINDPLEAGDFAAYPLADAVDLTKGDPSRTVINSMGLFIKAMEDVGLGDVFDTLDPKILVRWDGDADYVEQSPPDAGKHNDQPELRTILDAWGKPLRFVHPAWDGVITLEDNRGNPSPVGRFGGAMVPINRDAGLQNQDWFWLPADRAPPGFDPANRHDFPIEKLRRDPLSDEDRARWASGASGGQAGSLGTVSPIADADGGFAIGGRPYAYSVGPDGDPGKREDNVYTTTPQFAIE